MKSEARCLQVKDLLDRRLAHIFVGRTEQINLLMQMLDADGPLVMHLHGIAGSGKSTALEVFAQRARAAAAAVIRLDCGGVDGARGRLPAADD